MEMNRSRAAALGMMVVLAIQPVWADSDREAHFEELMAETQSRLDLSDEQLDQVRPVMQSAAEAQRSVLTRYGIDLEAEGAPETKLGMREARKLRSDLGKVRAETLEQLDDILTDEQLDELRKLQEERRQEMKKRIRGER
jgi:Spy/CpxP family protein refolding chaperone